MASYHKVVEKNVVDVEITIDGEKFRASRRLMYSDAGLAEEQKKLNETQWKVQNIERTMKREGLNKEGLTDEEQKRVEDLWSSVFGDDFEFPNQRAVLCNLISRQISTWDLTHADGSTVSLKFEHLYGGEGADKIVPTEFLAKYWSEIQSVPLVPKSTRTRSRNGST